MLNKIIIVEDEADIADLLEYNLRKEGFVTETVGDGLEALKKIRKGGYDLILLDLMLPGMDGLELCRVLRKDKDFSSIPIIILTAKGEEMDRVLGLELGADDYITKPFSIRELIARIKAVLRRARGAAEKENVLKIGEIEINTDTCQVTKRGVQLKLSATEFRLLLYLVQRKGKVFNRDMLLDALWKDEAFVEPRTVDVHVRRLRKLIEDDPSSPVYIKTRRGIGYYINGDL
jgi:phosphate regulon transcriptional regulator PhoB